MELQNKRALLEEHTFSARPHTNMDLKPLQTPKNNIRLEGSSLNAS